jgi:hypothetical protein
MVGCTYALRAALHGDARDAEWAAGRCFDAAFAQAEGDVVVGWAVTRSDNDACAASDVVQQEYRRQTRDLTLPEERGLTGEMRSRLERP